MRIISQELGKTAAKINNFVNLINTLRAELPKIGTAGVLNAAIVEATNYYEYLKDQDEETADDRISNVDELINKATAYESDHDEATLTGFLEEVALVPDN